MHGDGKEESASICASLLLTEKMTVDVFTFGMSCHYNPIQKRTVIPHIIPIEDLL